MRVEDRIRRFWLVEETKSPETVRYMLRRLRYMQLHGFNLARFLGDEDGAREEGLAFLEARRARGDVHGYNNYVKTLLGLARFARHETLTFKTLKAPKSIPKAYTASEVEALAAYRHKDKYREKRRRALIQACLTLGARRSEIAAMTTRDLMPDHNRVRIGKPAKGGYVRWVPVEPEFFAPTRPFAAWLKARPVDPANPDAIWTSRLRGGPRTMTGDSLAVELQKVGKETGVQPCNFIRSRHTRATTLLEAGYEETYITFYLGHNDPKSMRIYANVRTEPMERRFHALRLRSPYQV